ncbi:hypothetical protein [Sporosarcina sp. UB5]|uniref:hypothetical protein n=1 Tax=Sporosarcina sp. UB5 TaxID=3047463 RepID=UPI003D78EA66
MESLIILIVMGIISSFFKGKKSKEAPKTQKRQPTAQTDVNDPMRKLKEMTQEMYKEIQREFKTDIDEPPSRQSPERKPAPVISIPTEVREVERRSVVNTTQAPSDKKIDRTSTTREQTHRGRLSVHQGSLVSKESMDYHEMIPKNEEDLLKGIIFSEIFGPPKSKQ